MNPDEMALTSLETLAKTTEKKPLEASAFEMLMGRAITAYEEANDVAAEAETEEATEDVAYELCELEKKYQEFTVRFRPGFHEFLVDAVQEIRRNWYTYLLNSIGE